MAVMRSRRFLQVFITASLLLGALNNFWHLSPILNSGAEQQAAASSKDVMRVVAPLSGAAVANGAVRDQNAVDTGDVQEHVSTGDVDATGAETRDESESAEELPAAVSESKPAEEPQQPAAVSESESAEESPAAVSESKSVEEPQQPAAVSESKSAEEPQHPAAVSESKSVEEPSAAMSESKSEEPSAAMSESKSAEEPQLPAAVSESKSAEQPSATVSESKSAEQPSAAVSENESAEEPQQPTAVSESKSAEQPSAAVSESKSAEQPSAAVSESMSAEQPSATVSESKSAEQPSATVSESKSAEEPSAAVSESKSAEEPQQPAAVSESKSVEEPQQPAAVSESKSAEQPATVSESKSTEQPSAAVSESKSAEAPPAAVSESKSTEQPSATASESKSAEEPPAAVSESKSSPRRHHSDAVSSQRLSGNPSGTLEQSQRSSAVEVDVSPQLTVTERPQEFRSLFVNSSNADAGSCVSGNLARLPSCYSTEPDGPSPCSGSKAQALESLHVCVAWTYQRRGILDVARFAKSSRSGSAVMVDGLAMMSASPGVTLWRLRDAHATHTVEGTIVWTRCVAAVSLRASLSVANALTSRIR